jgi:ABC-type transport system substrate-binding protein
LVLARNEDYWGKKAKLEEVIFRPIPEEGTRAMAFESGEIDIISDPLPHRIAAYKRDKNIDISTGPATRTVWVGFNVGDKVLTNLKLRQAIAHAINRDEIVTHVVEGLAINANAWIPDIIEKSKKTYNFKYDPKLAKELLKEAGYPGGLELNLWTPEGRYLKDRQIAEAVQAQLAQVGIKTKIRVMEWGAYLDSLARHEQQLFIIGWGFSAGDPDTALRLCFYSTNQFNYSNYKSTTMDKLLDDAVSALDPKKRVELYEQVQQRLIDETIVVPIYHKLNIYAVNKKVNDFYPHPMERIEIAETSIK